MRFYLTTNVKKLLKYVNSKSLYKFFRVKVYFISVTDNLIAELDKIFNLSYREREKERENFPSLEVEKKFINKDYTMCPK